MADKELQYKIRLDIASAQAQATQLRALFQQSLQNIQVNILDPGALNSATSATNAIRAQYQQIATAAQTANQALGQAGTGSAQQTRAAYDAIARDAQQTAQSMQQAASQKPQAPTGGGGGLGGVGNALIGGAAAYFTVQGAKMIAQQAEAFAELGTQIRRADVSFRIISGGASQAAANLSAVKNAAAGTITTLTAEQLATQALNLHLADTAKGLGDVTRSAREVALVSPTIHDMGDAMTQLSLFASNVQSYQRADQLGLSASEVRQRIKELQAANGELDDSQAKLLASTQILDEKFGSLLDTTEAQASGVEKLKVAFSDLWAEIAKGSAGQLVDKNIGVAADAIERLGGRFNPSNVSGDLQAKINELQAGKNSSIVPLDTSKSAEVIAMLERIKNALDYAQKGMKNNVVGANEYAQGLSELGLGISFTNNVAAEQIAKLDQLAKSYQTAAVAAGAAMPNPQEQAKAAALKAQQERVAGLLEPINKFGNNLKDIGLDNFFLSLQDGLSKSAELTANETNRVAELRQQLVSIGQAVAEKNGVISPGQRSQVDAINAQIEALSQAAKLNKELQQAKPAAGQDLEGIYTRLNAIVAQTSGIMDQTANSARALGDAIAQSGSASAEQMAQLGDLAAQANQADFSRVAQSLQELNQGSLDAVPGVSSLREELTSFYDTLASGQGLTDEQAATLAGLAAEADALGGSTSALSDIQSQLGFKFLESHDYAAALVEQIANLSALYGAGSIGADQFAGGMGVLTGQLYGQLDAANALTPKLRELLALLGAVAGSRVAPGQAGGGIYTGNPGEQRPGLSPGFVSGQRQAEAAAAAARSKADSSARDEARAANAKAARGAQSAFEHAAQETEKAFEKVASNLEKSLEKVDGLLSNSKVTAEDMAAAKAGTYVQKADELRRQVESAANNPADRGRFASQIQQAKEALGRVGVQASDDLKVLAQQLNAAWNDSSLFSNKDNLKLINADAVKAAINLKANADLGRKNILEYFGATVDAVKEKFKAGDPEIVAAVGAELGASNDKNIQAMGDQLKAGGQKIIDKVLALAQASIDKTVGSLGSGASAGGGGGITVPTVSVGTPTGKAGTTGGTAGYLDGTAFAGGTVPMTGEITNIVLGPNAAQNFAEDLGTQFAESASAFTAIGASINTLISRGLSTVGKSADGAATSSLTTVAQNFAEDLGIQFSASAGAFTGLGAGIDVLIQSGFINVKRGNEMATAFTSALSAQFGGKDNAPTYSAMGDTISYMIESGFNDRKDRLDMATVFVDALKGQFGAKGGKGEASKQESLKDTGQDLSMMIEIGFINREDRLDMASGFNNALSQQFATAGANYGAIGDSVSYLIESGVANRKAEDRLDMATPFMMALSQQFSKQDFGSITKQIQDALNGASLDKETEGADGKIRKKPAMDFSSTASQITGSLSKAMGGQADFLKTIGDNASTFIGFGMTDHDFSATASTLIGSMTASFTTEQARTQLIAAGAALSGAVFQGFQSSLAYSPWLSAIVAEVVSQAATSLNSSLQDSLKPQALGF